jgi:hypothetical protein
MATNTQDAGNESYAGLYLRARRQIRSWSWSLFWSWDKKKLADVSEAETERPWAGVAEWLRVAHSLLDDRTVDLTRNPD